MQICIYECRTFVASEANAIDYARGEGHYLGSHCDDRYIIYICICKYVYMCVCIYIYMPSTALKGRGTTLDRTVTIGI